MVNDAAACPPAAAGKPSRFWLNQDRGS